MKRSLDSSFDKTEKDNGKPNVKLRKCERVNKLSLVLNRYDSQFPYFRKPQEIGTFSLDLKRRFHNDKHQLRYYIKPVLSNPKFDLKQGYRSFIKKDEGIKENLDDMLRWIMHNHTKFALNAKHTPLKESETASLNTDFICWRGLLTKLLCTPYERLEAWKIAVTKYRGTYFLCEFDSEDKIKRQQEMSEKQEEMCYWGWKFEQYVCADKVNGLPDTSQAVNNNEAFCSVVRTRLQSHSLVYGGEIDALDPSIAGDNKYVELKTSRIIQSERQEKNFKRHKLIKWWAQSFLVNIQKIVCGFRDDNGIVQNLMEYHTQNIPGMAKELSDTWKPNVCFNFLEQFLQFLKDNIQEDDSEFIHLLTWKPYAEVICQALGVDSEYKFLPKWFKDWTV